MPVVKNVGVEDFGDNFLYGSEATIDGNAVEIRGGDIEEDSTVSITFDPNDLPAIAHDLLDGYTGDPEYSQRRVRSLARTTVYSEEDLLRNAHQYLAAVLLRRTGTVQTAEIHEVEVAA